MTTHTDKESFVAQNPGPSRPEDSIAIPFVCKPSPDTVMLWVNPTTPLAVHFQLTCIPSQK